MGQAKKTKIEHILSERLRIGRTRIGLTQQALARLTGFSLSAIGNWESRQNIPTPAKLGVLAGTLGVSIDYLLGHDSGPAAQPPPTPPSGAARQIKQEIREVPIVSWAQAGALVAYTYLNATWHEYTATTCRDETSFAATAACNSSEPKYGSSNIGN